MKPLSKCRRTPARPAGFTLIEALLALAISAVVLSAIGGVFYSAMRLRDRTIAALEPVSRVHPAISIIRRDLKGATWPGGVMTGVFRCGALGAQFGDALGLQFSTTTGTLSDTEPFGETQEVIYELRDSTSGKRGAGKDLIRSVNRNLLTALTDTPQEALLLSGVETFEVSCYDGLQWQPAWDTSLTETNLPLAVRVQIELADESDPGSPDSADSRAYELLVPLMVQSPTNAVESSTEEATP